MSTCLSMIQPLLQQTTNIWKIPAQTDLTCSGMLLQLCSGPSILLISSTIWCSFWLISAPLLSESNQGTGTEDCSIAASQSGCVHLRSIERARYATKHLRDTDSDYVMENRKFYEGRRPEVEFRLHEEVKAKCDSVCKAQIFLSNPKFRAI